MKQNTIKKLREMHKSNTESIKQIVKQDNFDSDSGYSDFIAENKLIETVFKLERIIV